VATDLAFVALAALAAGFIDAIVGGGGLVLVPALFATYPSLQPADLLGTNKASGVWGTAWAARAFANRIPLAWTMLLPATLAAFAGSLEGASLVTRIEPRDFRAALPILLAAMLAYTLWRKDLGREHTPRLAGVRETAAAMTLGVLIGFYDGFFGPGTGSLLVFGFVRLLGYDFLNASACAKVLNTATNLAALLVFGWHGHVWWQVAAVLAVANVAGSWFGARLALRRGAGFVRRVFIVVVAILILKTAWIAWLG
jgi:uncharacterized membrane protein YfcA